MNVWGWARRVRRGLGFLGLMIVLLLAVAAAGHVEAKPKFSAISVDARTGKVLFSVDPDGQRFPASLTKVMTLYLLFEDLKSGKIKLETSLKVSARAAGMAPSKLGLKQGSTITVDDAIRALVTKSANDVAVAIGENLGGSESKFAERMTRTARAIGMSRTTFRNASGLPNPGQVTTARDMATLCLRIQRDFPQYYPYFRITSFTYKGRTIRSHNRLLGRYEGTDGIKTGYIGASGFNLTTSVRRGDKRLVGVVLGSKTGASRNAYMIGMLDKSFPKAKGGKTIAALAGSSKGAIDPIAAAEEPAKQKTIADLILKPKEGPAPEDAKAAEANSASPEDEDTAEEGTAGSAFQAVDAAETQEPQVLEAKIAEAAIPADLPFEVKPEASQSSVGSAMTTAGDASWYVQVGAFEDKRDAQKRLLSLKKAQPSLLKDKMAFTVTVQKGSERTYRARFSGFSEADAKALCGRLSKQKVDCQPLPPQT